MAGICQVFCNYTNMKKAVTFLLFACCFGLKSAAQDTIRIEKRVNLSAREFNNGRAVKSRYAREDIVLSANSRRIDYCYYYKNSRYCFGDTYTLSGEATLKISDQEWTYEKQPNGQFLVHRLHEGLYESGLADQLVPLGKIRIASIYPVTGDTLWMVDYKTFNTADEHRSYFYPKAKTAGKVYEMNQVETMPTFPDGTALPQKIKHSRSDGCYNEPFYFVDTMSFIVTGQGAIKNIQQEAGNFELAYCPQYILELMKIICAYGTLKPATLHGENVQVKYRIAIEKE